MALGGWSRAKPLNSTTPQSQPIVERRPPAPPSGRGATEAPRYTPLFYSAPGPNAAESADSAGIKTTTSSRRHNRCPRNCRSTSTSALTARATPDARHDTEPSRRSTALSERATGARQFRESAVCPRKSTSRGLSASAIGEAVSREGCTCCRQWRFALRKSSWTCEMAW